MKNILFLGACLLLIACNQKNTSSTKSINSNSEEEAKTEIIEEKEQLQHVFKDEIDVDDRTIDSHVKRIRKKFKKIDPEFNSIHTLYGSGYQWK